MLPQGRFEYANAGTLFLDEVGDMPPLLQAKLLRVLENQEVVRVGSNETISVNVRVVSATHRNLEALMPTGVFREDLFFRLNGVTVTVPPLRERGNGDLRLLAEHCLARAAKHTDQPVPTLHESVWNPLFRYSWPGNVRELHTVIRRAVLICRGAQILPSDLELGSSVSASGFEDKEAGPETHILRAVDAAMKCKRTDLHAYLQEVLERELLRCTLAECGGNQVQTAQRLGISRNGLRAKMQAHGLP